jgi:hypothetical protein
MMGAELFGFEAVMLDGIELLAHGCRMPLSGIPNPLEVGAVNLSALRKTLAEKRLQTIPEQGMLISDLCVSMPLHAFELAKKFGMCRLRTGQLSQFTVKLGNPLVVDSVNRHIL